MDELLHTGHEEAQESGLSLAPLRARLTGGADALRARPFFLCRSRRISRILCKYDLKGIKPKILTVFRPYFALILMITQVENLLQNGYNNICTKIIRSWRNIHGS